MKQRTTNNKKDTAFNELFEGKTTKKRPLNRFIVAVRVSKKQNELFAFPTEQKALIFEKEINEKGFDTLTAKVLKAKQ